MIPLLWCDIETTGLKAEDLILEVAFIATDENLKEEGRFNIVICQPAVEVFLSDYTREMHTVNGLLKEVAESTTHFWDAEKKLIEWMEPYNGRPIAGSSVHWDRAWLKEWMPELEKLFSHRNFDVSTLRAFLAFSKSTNINHRAMDDLVSDIGETVAMHKQVYTDATGDSSA